MGRKKYLIDSNVAIDYFGENLPEQSLEALDSIFDGQFCFSVINKIELLGFRGLTTGEEDYMKELIGAAIVIGLTEEIIALTVDIRKKHKVKLPDCIIAATAMTEDLILLTRNAKDFEQIKGLRSLNPAVISTF